MPRLRPEDDPLITGVKRCGACEQTKPVDQFYWLNGQRKRYQAYCKPCTKRKAAERVRDKREARTGDREHHGRSAIVGATYAHRGYVFVKVGRDSTAHHRADQYGWVYEHIINAEKRYGIKITREMTVHHRNRIKNDNRPENLEVRLGNHGVGGDIIPALLADPELRRQAADVLTAYGWICTENLITLEHAA